MRWLISGTILLCLAFTPIALAQSTPDGTTRSQSVGEKMGAEEAQTRLQEIQTSISISNEKIENLRKEIAELDGNRTRQNAALVAAAQRVKLAEIEVDEIAERLAISLESEARVRRRVDGTDQEISTLLAALQRLGASPPPALIVKAEDAVGSARSAMLLAAILPQLRDKTTSIRSDLKQLVEIRQAAENEEELFRVNLATLYEEQLRIATLIEARNQGMTRVRQSLAEEEREAEELAARATSLDELIRELGDNIDTISDAADAAFSTGSVPDALDLDPKSIQLAFANIERDKPAIPFGVAQGYLTVPAAGTIVGKFNNDDGFGGRTKGVSVMTRADAQIVAPADGWVMYKGPYLNYGQIIIINPGSGYTFLLAGLDATNVDLGQFVRMGEPIGTMGSRTIGQAVTTNAGVSRPTLYIELKRHDTPLDPTSWWSDKSNETQSG